mgnify:CR=1 FL=1
MPTERTRRASRERSECDDGEGTSVFARRANQKWTRRDSRERSEREDSEYRNDGSERSEWTRREWLSAVGAAGIATVAGCSSGGNGTPTTGATTDGGDPTTGTGVQSGGDPPALVRYTPAAAAGSAELTHLSVSDFERVESSFQSDVSTLIAQDFRQVATTADLSFDAMTEGAQVSGGNGRSGGGVQRRRRDAPAGRRRGGVRDGDPRGARPVPLRPAVVRHHGRRRRPHRRRRGVPEAATRRRDVARKPAREPN